MKKNLRIAAQIFKGGAGGIETVPQVLTALDQIDGKTSVRASEHFKNVFTIEMSRHFYITKRGKITKILKKYNLYSESRRY